ncbi:hypothetical protein SAMN05444392_11940 [Seinonella peptonophila]|uniref:DUF7660 domain-containing protein n=1 Tax=Seinonella peptonophila TaxID=112248 RepID=A0A1M5B906_9BACL|nr:hypothetical protein SAMN05444392_11940 [Seinonella peptonophila]
MNLTEINKIKDKNDFLAFMDWIIKDFQNNRIEWENTDLLNYFEAIQSWIGDMEGFYQNTGQTEPKEVDWRFIATILIAAKFYE